MKTSKTIICSAMLISVLSFTAFSKTGTISTTKTGTISTTRTGTISTTASTGRAGTISTTSTVRPQSAFVIDGSRILELLAIVYALR